MSKANGEIHSPDASYSKEANDNAKSKLGSILRHPVVLVLLFALVGVAVGIGLSTWSTETDAKDTALQWIGLIGDLFVRSLKAIVLPLVFVSVVLAVVEMMSIGRASSVGWKTIALYLVTTVIASVIAVIAIVSFKGLFSEGEPESSKGVEVTLGCSQAGTYLTENANASVTCAASSTPDDPPAAVKFSFKDLSKTLATNKGGPDDDLSLSDTIYDGIFRKLVTDNILSSFSDGQFAAVVFFAIFFGCAFARHMSDSGEGTEGSSLFRMLKDAEGTLVALINWVILITPLAVFSLICKALGSQDELRDAFSNVGYLVLATIVAMVVHAIVVHGVILTAVLRCNPLNYLRFLGPAQAMAFASASSAATIPVTLRSVASSGMVPDAVGKFVVPLGATMNMDGSAIYFPCACVWLAVLNGINPTVADYILLVIIATVGSAGTAPVPSASLVLIITAYNTVFGTTGTPSGFEFILAIDWFMDRLRTTLNVTGDASVSAMVAKLTSSDNIGGTSASSSV